MECTSLLVASHPTQWSVGHSIFKSLLGVKGFGVNITPKRSEDYSFIFAVYCVSYRRCALPMRTGIENMLITVH